METLLLIPVDDSVVFPNMTVTLTVDVGDEERVLIVPRKDDEFASVGTVAEVAEHVRLPGGGHAVALSGLHRAIAGPAASHYFNLIWCLLLHRHSSEDFHRPEQG